MVKAPKKEWTIIYATRCGAVGSYKTDLQPVDHLVKVLRPSKIMARYVDDMRDAKVQTRHFVLESMLPTEEGGGIAWYEEV